MAQWYDGARAGRSTRKIGPFWVPAVDTLTHAAPPRSASRAPRRRQCRQRDRELVRDRRALGVRELPLRRRSGRDRAARARLGAPAGPARPARRASRWTGSGPGGSSSLPTRAAALVSLSFLLAGSFPVLVALAALHGVTSAFSGPALRALPPRLVGEDKDLVARTPCSAAAAQSAIVLGPLLAAAAIGSWASRARS